MDLSLSPHGGEPVRAGLQSGEPLENPLSPRGVCLRGLRATATGADSAPGSPATAFPRGAFRPAVRPTSGARGRFRSSVGVPGGICGTFQGIPQGFHLIRGMFRGTSRQFRGIGGRFRGMYLLFREIGGRFRSMCRLFHGIRGRFRPAAEGRGSSSRHKGHSAHRTGQSPAGLTGCPKPMPHHCPGFQSRAGEAAGFQASRHPLTGALVILPF
jgi:hypothetical protein